MSTTTIQTQADTTWNKDVWQRKFYSGGWTSLSETTLQVQEPATGELLIEVAAGDATHIRQAAAAARAAQRDWARTPGKERAAVLERAAEFFEQHRDACLTWLIRESGSVRPKAEQELHLAINTLRTAAELADAAHEIVLPATGESQNTARRIPRGVVGLITPFNFPLSLAVRTVAPALALGNAVILKPDPRTPCSGGFILASALEAAGLSADLLHVIPGTHEAGAALCSDPDVAMISFTGSTEAGRKVGALAAQHLKKVSLELGGKNAFVVLDDADLNLAVSHASFGSFFHQGQICLATGRILVHRNIAKEFVEQLAKRAGRLSVGDPMAPRTALGPLIDAGQCVRVHSIVQDSVAAGAELRAGGSCEGLMYQATVLDGVKPGMRAFDEEIFGPVAAVTTFESEAQAVDLVHAGGYGLVASVFAASTERALEFGRNLNVAMLHVNQHTIQEEAHAPFGGLGASGNGSSQGGPANLDEFTTWHWITVEAAPRRMTPF